MNLNIKSMVPLESALNSLQGRGKKKLCKKLTTTLRFFEFFQINF
jgi:hypothetical protein